MDNKNLFFGLGSVLLALIILSMLGVLGQTQQPKKVVVHKDIDFYYPPAYGKKANTKAVIYAPDYYVRPNTYKQKYYN